MSSRLLRRLSIVLAAGALLAALPTVASADGVRFRNGAYPDSCLVSQAPPKNTTAFVFQCGPWADQYWEVFPRSTGLGLQNVHSGLCLVLQGNPSAGRAFSYYCSAFADQSFEFYYVNQTSVQIRSTYGGGCLRATPDRWVAAGSCTRTASNTWYIQ